MQWSIQFCLLIPQGGLRLKASSFFEIDWLLTCYFQGMIKTFWHASLSSPLWYEQTELDGSLHPSLKVWSKHQSSILLPLLWKNSCRSHNLTQAKGITNEDTAQKAYLESAQEQHSNLEYFNSGLHINPSCPHLGATPDGIRLFSVQRDIMWTCTFPLNFPPFGWSLWDPAVLPAIWPLSFPVQRDIMWTWPTPAWYDPCQTL